MKKIFGMLVLAGAAAGCGQADLTLGAGEPGMGLDSTKQEEAWSSQDNPALFGAGLETKLEALPDVGEAQNIPWAGNYWPVYEDSINHKWAGAGSDSPSLKYQKAFGGTNVEDLVSKHHGIDAQSSRKECSQSSDCESGMGEVCSKREGKDKGRCIPTWWGICHAWAPAAILVPEPKHEVTKNGVTFKVQDIKALVTLAHNSTKTKFVSLRCNKMQTQPDGGSGIAYDPYGRPSSQDSECRDTNPGTYHLLLANYLGKLKQAFVEDRTWDHEVWNQPVRGYRVTSKKEVSAQEANRLIGATSVGGTAVKKTATVAKDAWQHFEAFAIQAGQSIKVVMTGSGDGDLFVKFGAQPTAQAYDCRPYDSGSAETCELVAPAGATQVFVSVNGYAASSAVELAITVGGSVPTAYQFNPKAVKFVQIASEVDYISESSSSTDGNLGARIDQYTRTDRYEYILELDGAGNVVGGEWLGASKKAHPDFLWLPTGVGSDSVAGGAIKYASVKALLDASIAPEGGGTTGGSTKEQTESGTLAKGAWKQLGPFAVVAGGTFKVEMTGTGDADLYVKKGMAPTASVYDCRPYKGGSAESCEASGEGAYYVGVYGYATSSTFTVKITWTGAGGAVTPPPSVFTHLDVSGSVAQGELKVFELVLPAGKKVTLTTSAPSDVDLYVKMGSAPTLASYDARGYTASGNESITYTATEAGKLYVAVHGYQASTFTLKSRDN